MREFQPRRRLTFFRLMHKPPFDYGTVVQTVERQPDWVKVRLANGKTGWVANSLLWGW